VKLLLDENLSRRLVDRLADLFPGSTHVAFAGLLQAPDAHIWEYAKEKGFALVTADADFYEMATAFGPPPKVIWLRRCDYATHVAESLIRRQAIRVSEFLLDPDQAVLILTP
jgi:predicted nuclease of predicted toxin-antitoxin system